MTLQIINGAGGIATSSVTLAPAQLGLNSTFSGFGLLTGGIGEANSINIADVYIDNLVYSFTPVPEPASMILAGLPFVGLAFQHCRGRRQSRPSIQN